MKLSLLRLSRTDLHLVPNLQPKFKSGVKTLWSGLTLLAVGVEHGLWRTLLRKDLQGLWMQVYLERTAEDTLIIPDWSDQYQQGCPCRWDVCLLLGCLVNLSIGAVKCNKHTWLFKEERVILLSPAKVLSHLPGRLRSHAKSGFSLLFSDSPATTNPGHVPITGGRFHRPIDVSGKQIPLTFATQWHHTQTAAFHPPSHQSPILMVWSQSVWHN